MTTNNDNTGDSSILSIRATSGGERGKEGSGTKHEYELPKVLFMELVSEVFDKEVANSKPENAKSGGAIAQFLHSYGATAEKQEKSGIDPFPGKGGMFKGDNVASWLEVMEFRAPRTAGNRKSAKEIRMDAALTTLALNLPGVTWTTIAPAYPDITEADLEAYKAKLAAKE